MFYIKTVKTRFKTEYLTVLKLKQEFTSETLFLVYITFPLFSVLLSTQGVKWCCSK